MEGQRAISKKAERSRLARARETSEQRESRLLAQRLRKKARRDRETVEERQARLADLRSKQRARRQRETAEQREARLAQLRKRQRVRALEEQGVATSSPSASRPYIPIVPSCATLPNLLTPYAFNTSITATSSSSSATQTSLSTISPPTHRPILPALPGKSAKYTANLAALARLVSKVQKQHTHSPEHKAMPIKPASKTTPDLSSTVAVAPCAKEAEQTTDNEEDSSEDSEDDESVAAPVQPPEQTHAKPKLDTPHSSNLPAAGIENYEMQMKLIDDLRLPPGLQSSFMMNPFPVQFPELATAEDTSSETHVDHTATATTTTTTTTTVTATTGTTTSTYATNTTATTSTITIGTTNTTTHATCATTTCATATTGTVSIGTSTETVAPTAHGDGDYTLHKISSDEPTPNTEATKKKGPTVKIVRKSNKPKRLGNNGDKNSGDVEDQIRKRRRPRGSGCLQQEKEEELKQLLEDRAEFYSLVLVNINSKIASQNNLWSRVTP